MVREVSMYFSDEKVTREFLNDAQLRADRDSLIAQSRDSCNDCVLSGHLTTWGELVLECAARSHESLDAAIEQEATCEDVHRGILNSIEGQAEVYLQGL